MLSRPQVHIISDGTPSGTRITTPDGEEIRATSAWVNFGASDLAYATIEVNMPHVETKAEVYKVNFQCPCCTHVMEHECGTTKT